MNRISTIGRWAVAAGLATVLGATTGCIIVETDRGWYQSGWSSYDDDRPWVGVYTDSVPGSTGAQLGIDRDHATLITHVIAGGPADRAGVRKYDVVVELNGTAHASESDFRRAIRSTHDGDTLSVAVMREGQRLDLTITPEPRNASRHDAWRD